MALHYRRLVRGTSHMIHWFTPWLRVHNGKEYFCLQSPLKSSSSLKWLSPDHLAAVGVQLCRESVAKVPSGLENLTWETFCGPGIFEDWVSLIWTGHLLTSVISLVSVYERNINLPINRDCGTAVGCTWNVEMDVQCYGYAVFWEVFELQVILSTERFWVMLGS